MLSDEDRVWLKELHAELWPPKEDADATMLRRLDVAMGRTPRPKPSEPRELLTLDELKRIFKVVEDAPLLTVLRSHGVICGVGIQFFEHEPYPGTGPEKLLFVVDDHIPRLDDRTVYQHMKKVPPKVRKHAAGDIREDVWELFSKYTHTQQNREWLTQYKIKMRFDKQSYDY